HIAEMPMDELKQIDKLVKPDDVFLVCDAMTGQDAVNSSRAFNDALSLNGVILTKLDGDARGGAALSVKEVVGRPIAFASTGEKLDDFDLFHPDRMADRILGMGDVLSLIEQAERTLDKEVATKGAAAILRGRFTLEDFLEQLQQVKRMGSISGVLSHLPGVSKDLKQASDTVDDGRIGQIEAIIQSMTPKERVDPAVIDGSRRVRIANGSGTTTAEVNALLKQFREMQKLMKGMGKGAMPSALGGLFGRGAKLPPQAMAELAGLGDGGTDPLAGSDPLDAVGPRVSNRPVGGGSRAKGKGGKKGKGGGRVTPKSR
ncbi:MAG TPA: signal recognition particle protein, partial [Acidimicrobiales bacterium]|nr:signal recognition particle protein [Acidimicrobiales bacterium]